MQNIIERVNTHFGINVADKNRSHDVLLARWCAVYLLRSINLPLKVISPMVGLKMPCAAYQSHKRALKEMKQNPKMVK